MVDLIEIRDEYFNELIRSKLARELMKFAPEPMTISDINDLVNGLLTKIEWNNEVFVEMVFSWIAKIYWDAHTGIC